MRGAARSVGVTLQDIGAAAARWPTRSIRSRRQPVADSYGVGSDTDTLLTSIENTPLLAR
jgi:hypothetical protein